MTGQVIWIMGLSGAGKTTLAQGLSLRLKHNDLRPILLDGDILRSIFKSDGLEEQFYVRSSRINLALKYGLLCQNLSEQGFTVIISTIAMFDEIYAWNRENFKKYFEVYLKVPLNQLYLRDNKKIYERYKAGIINDVAGLDLPIDEPKAAHVVYDFDRQPILWERPENLTNCLIEELVQRSFLTLKQKKFK
tara:strand:- start:311 stop:883 length:573 start_codon:yes stop_codon:yes gene_type:complete